MPPRKRKRSLHAEPAPPETTWVDALDYINHARYEVERARFMLSQRDDFAPAPRVIPREFGFLVDTADDVLGPALTHLLNAGRAMRENLDRLPIPARQRRISK